MSGLIWVHSGCKGYHQAALVTNIDVGHIYKKCVANSKLYVLSFLYFLYNF